MSLPPNVTTRVTLGGINILLKTAILSILFNEVRLFDITIQSYISLTELCPCGNAQVEHEQMQAILIPLVMHGGNGHAAPHELNHTTHYDSGLLRTSIIMSENPSVF